MIENKNIIKNDEIDLVELAKVIWSRKWFIVKITGLIVLLGLLIAFTSPKEYQTSCTLIPEAMDGGGGLGGSLGGLAALAGVDLGVGSGANSGINPGLYRSVVQSTPFLLELMSKEFYFEELEKKITLYDYNIKHQKTSLFEKIFSIPYYLINLIKPNREDSNIAPGGVGEYNIIFLTNYQEAVAADLKDRILVTMDWDLNLVTVEVEMQDPRVAAEVTNFTQNYITNYVEQYSVSKSQEQLSFAEKQYQERKKEFELLQLELASFRDQNQFVNTAKARSEEERLLSRYNLSFNIYNQLAQQVETVKLQINEDMPVFTVLEPVKIPINKSGPSILTILSVSFLIGIFLSIFYILVHRFVVNL